jgi:hypothetical protein
MAKKLGEVMGLFAYGHPFLDGNGRTMLLVHMELCHRAGFSIDWHKARKADYLAALSREIETPGKGILDDYLQQFKAPQVVRDKWGASILAMRGLDGLDDDNLVEGDIADPAIAEKYRQIETKRGYSYESSLSSVQTSGLHIGPVVAVEPGRIGQQIAKLGDSVEINYANGVGIIKPKERSRSHSPER